MLRVCVVSKIAGKLGRPVRFARALGADVVIAIDIFCGSRPDLKGHALDTILSTFRLQSCLLSEAEIAEADILIRPDYEPASPISFAGREQAIEAGYRAAQRAMPALRTKLQQFRN